LHVFRRTPRRATGGTPPSGRAGRRFYWIRSTHLKPLKDPAKPVARLFERDGASRPAARRGAPDRGRSQGGRRARRGLARRRA